MKNNNHLADGASLYDPNESSPSWLTKSTPIKVKKKELQDALNLEAPDVHPARQKQTAKKRAGADSVRPLK
jgi:hypothetical protein